MENTEQQKCIIRTLTGIKLDLLNPTEDMINIHDIAIGLAQKCHYGGQTPMYFSLAMHSILVHDLFNTRERRNFLKLRLVALLHDASEAYMGDMVKPLKSLLPEFERIEHNLTDVIMSKYGVIDDYKIHYKELVKPVDIEAQKLEHDAFYTANCDARMLLEYRYKSSPQEDAKEFIDLFNHLKIN